MADVGFNILSPWTGSERGWKTYLAKSGSRLYKGNGKKSIKLMGAQRTWWALSGRSKGRGKENSSRRPPKGIEDMEIDSLKDRGRLPLLLGSCFEGCGLRFRRKARLESLCVQKSRCTLA